MYATGLYAFVYRTKYDLKIAGYGLLLCVAPCVVLNNNLKSSINIKQYLFRFVFELFYTVR